MSDLPKMLSKREIELEELEEAKYVQSLRDENQKLQEQLNTAKKALTEIIFFSQGCYDSEYFASIARKALAAIGGDGCPVGPIGKNGLTKEELEGSSDE